MCRTGQPNEKEDFQEPWGRRRKCLKKLPHEEEAFTFSWGSEKQVPLQAAPRNLRISPSVGATTKFPSGTAPRNPRILPFVGATTKMPSTTASCNSPAPVHHSSYRRYGFLRSKKDETSSCQDSLISSAVAPSSIINRNSEDPLSLSIQY